jgi:hypothetical protein
MALMERSPGTQSFSHDEGHRGYHMITIDNEDDGRRTTIMASAVEKIADIIGELYQRLGRERLDGDRLRWESDDEDVAAFAQLTLGEYFELGQCPHLHWVFVGPTGGDCPLTVSEVVAARFSG